jgi:hypothetical protein
METILFNEDIFILPDSNDFIPMIYLYPRRSGSSYLQVYPALFDKACDIAF